MNETYPSMQTRYSAMIIDIVVIVGLMYFFATLFDSMENVPDWLRIFAFVFVFALYEPLTISFFGGSIGHYLCGIRVKRFQYEEHNIGLIHAVIRYFLKIILGIVSFITVSSNDQSRAIHDLVTGSVVVRK